jgi:hypothetical protein
MILPVTLNRERVLTQQRQYTYYVHREKQFQSLRRLSPGPRQRGVEASNPPLQAVLSTIKYRRQPSPRHSLAAFAGCTVLGAYPKVVDATNEKHIIW